jgi:hypothetical protein
MFSTLTGGLIVNRTNKALHALVTCAAMFALTGCGDSKQVTEVKALPFSYPSDNVRDPNLTVDQALDHRKICASTKWRVLMTEQHQFVVQYDCAFEGVKDSLLIAVDKKQQPPNYMFPDKIGDLYQWTYGADGKPELSYVALHYHFPNGTSKDIRSSGPIASDGGLDFTGTGWVVVLMEEAVKQNIETYDQFRSDVYGVHIPVKPASPIRDTTYGNTLSTLYPGKSPKTAAALAYVWQGAPADMQTFGTDELGYLRVQHDPAYYHLLFPVNPADVQISTKDDSAKPYDTPPKPPQLSPDKLYCVNEQCYDSDQGLVGRAPPSILAQETVPSGSQAAPSAAPTQSAVPADDPKAIAEMTSIAQMAANANPSDSNDINAGQLDGMSNPTNEPLWAGKPRNDGYPNYAVTCDFNKQVCTFLNGMGNPLEEPIADVSRALTVMRNADVESGKYTCRHGICVDAQMNLVGRLSASIAQVDSAATQ